jgi:hypothetical protein
MAKLLWGQWFITTDTYGNLVFQYFADTVFTFSQNGKITVTPFIPSPNNETTAGAREE